MGPRPFTDPSCSTSQSLGSSGWTRFPFRDENLCLFLLCFGVFSVTTCGVSVQRAALVAYNQSMSGQRVMYQLQNSHRKRCHPMKVAFATAPIDRPDRATASSPITHQFHASHRHPEPGRPVDFTSSGKIPVKSMPQYWRRSGCIQKL